MRSVPGHPHCVIKEGLPRFFVLYPSPWCPAMSGEPFLSPDHVLGLCRVLSHTSSGSRLSLKPSPSPDSGHPGLGSALISVDFLSSLLTMWREICRYLGTLRQARWCWSFRNDSESGCTPGGAQWGRRNTQVQIALLSECVSLICSAWESCGLLPLHMLGDAGGQEGGSSVLPLGSRQIPAAMGMYGDSGIPEQGANPHHHYHSRRGSP